MFLHPLLYLGADSLLHGITCKSMEEISGTDNWNALIDFNSTQVLITGNNEICLSLSGTGQDVIIGGVVFDDVRNSFRCDDFCHSRKAFCPSFEIILRPLEFLPEDVGELGYDSRGYEESVGSFEGMFPNASHFSVYITGPLSDCRAKNRPGRQLGTSLSSTRPDRIQIPHPIRFSSPLSRQSPLALTREETPKRPKTWRLWPLNGPKIPRFQLEDSRN
jgi:hypothetical protein